MKSLPNVTLIAFDGVNVAQTARVVSHCSKLIQFGKVLIVTDHPMQVLNHGFQPSEVMMTGFATKNDYMQWEIMHQFHCVQTDYCLFVSHDGMIINPLAWEDEFLNYDYIGAPWPAWWIGKSVIGPNLVGNGGFYLTSKRFLKACHDCAAAYRWGFPSDIWRCQVMYHAFVGMGLKYAPVATAARFSWESTDDGCGNKNSFGYHGFRPEKTFPLL